MDDLGASVRRERPDAIVITGNLLDTQTLQLVRQQLWSGAAVLGLADVGDPQLEARLRAVGFNEVLAKPVPADELLGRVQALLARRTLAEETGLYGESEAVREVLVKVEQMAPVSSTVLIEGESGTGKELVARAIHRLSPRRAKPFIAVNVGALPETLLESELFGHEKGSFTGAAERRIGRFELAHGGTIFLDEIGDVPQSTQVKLLRVLEEREVTRVGGTQTIPVDVRVVAATNRPLRDAVERGHFRSDLYYRLNVLSIYLPPLRERRDDIVLLVRRFVQEFSQQHDREFRGITPEALAALVSYAWPGNVRELRNLVESMVVLAHGREIGVDDIPPQIRGASGAGRLLPVHIGPVMREGERAEGRELEFIVRSLVELKLQVEELRRRVDDDRTHLANLAAVGVAGASGGLGALVGGVEPPSAAPATNVVTITPGMTMAQIERAAIENALRETRGNRRKAAEILDIGERTLYRKLKEYGLPVTGFDSDN
ncbi:MAG: sigma-54-dependent Fis family transcriptional regulator [Gemmatimonadetes bacterium]|nr:sigma-54-dependent Fis family transcriptional regulator [Gemmatimonadota bacterium]